MVWLKQYFAGSYLEPPFAIFTITSQSSTSVTLSAVSSYDNDGNIVSYSWNFGDGTTGSQVTTSHTYSISGIYTIILTITDNTQLTSNYSITVTMAVPLASCHSKFVGSTIKFQTVDKYFDLYWNQVTP
jgi:PKD repeat protein